MDVILFLSHFPTNATSYIILELLGKNVYNTFMVMDVKDDVIYYRRKIYTHC